MASANLRGVPVAKLGVRGLYKPRGVLDQEGELLGKSPPDDGVVLFEPHLDRFAGEDLLLDEVGDHALHLGGLGLTQPLPAPGLDNPADVAFGHAYRPGSRRLSVASDPGLGAKQQPAGREEVENGLPQKLHKTPVRRQLPPEGILQEIAIHQFVVVFHVRCGVGPGQ